jgi:hypothetical protein
LHGFDAESAEAVDVDLTDEGDGAGVGVQGFLRDGEVLGSLREALVVRPVVRVDRATLGLARLTRAPLRAHGEAHGLIDETDIGVPRLVDDVERAVVPGGSVGPRTAFAGGDELLGEVGATELEGLAAVGRRNRAREFGFP